MLGGEQQAGTLPGRAAGQSPGQSVLRPGLKLGSCDHRGQDSWGCKTHAGLHPHTALQMASTAPPWF